MPSRLELLIAERRRRRALAGMVTPAAVAFMAAMVAIVAALRADFHGPQARFYSSKAKRRAAKTTRRSGKTSGGTRETLARCLSIPGYRVLYCNTTKAEAKRLAWRSDTRKDGWLDLLRLYGLRVTHKREKLEAGKADCFVDETEKTIDFANGSQLAIFCADDTAALDKIRGVAKHVVWVDEAQKFVDLGKFCDEVIGASMADFQGEIWITGTPSEFAAGYYYEVSKEADQGERLAGWEVHEWSVLDNPFFGKTREERFDAVLLPEIMRSKPRSYKLSDETWVADFLAKPPPGYRREWVGRWVLEGALFVYPVHNVADKDLLSFAPQRLTKERPRAEEGHLLESIDVEELGWYDHAAAVEDLPKFIVEPVTGKRRRITWMFALSADFGFDPDPFALSLLAFSPDCRDVYEMLSWKQTRVHPDDQRDAVRWMLKNVPGIVVSVGDAGGLQKGHMVGWRERLGVEMDDAEKSSKRTWITLMGAEITSGRFHYRDDSPLLHEHKHLLWIVSLSAGKQKWTEFADRVLPDKTVPGNHCSDAGLYGYRHLVYRRTEFPGFEDLPQAVKDAREEASIERSIDERTAMAEWQEDDPAEYAAGDYNY